MRLEKHDIEILLPLLLKYAQTKNTLKIHSLGYELENNAIQLKMNGTYQNMPIRIDLYLVLYLSQQQLACELLDSRIDSLLMKGDLLPLLKVWFNHYPDISFDGRTIYFCHPNLSFKSLSVNGDGIEILFN